MNKQGKEHLVLLLPELLSKSLYLKFHTRPTDSNFRATVFGTHCVTL